MQIYGSQQSESEAHDDVEVGTRIRSRISRAAVLMWQRVVVLMLKREVVLIQVCANHNCWASARVAMASLMALLRCAGGREGGETGDAWHEV